jgi:hypothetical protein
MTPVRAAMLGILERHGLTAAIFVRYPVGRILYRGTVAENRRPVGLGRIKCPTQYSRRRDRCHARDLVWWELHRMLPGASFPTLARETNARSHATIIVGIRRHQKRLDAASQEPAP